MANAANWHAILDKLTRVLAKTGNEGWLVGGCLRDALLSLPVADVDVAVTSAPLAAAERLARLLPASVARLGHDTIRLVPRRAPDVHLDLTPLQGSSIADDLARRDFTVNAMALPLASRDEWTGLLDGQCEDMPDLLDPFGGRGDVMARRLVAVGPDVFRDDPGRVIRAARLRARLGLLPDAETLRLLREAAPLLATLSPDRLREEMALLLALPAATDGVALLDAIGALSVVYPGLHGDAAAHALATLRQLDVLMGGADGEAGFPALRAWSASAARRVSLRLQTLDHARIAHNDRDDIASSSSSTLWREARSVLETEGEGERLHAARLLFMDAGNKEDAAADALLVAAACSLTGGDQQRGTTLAGRADKLLGIYLRDREQLIPPPLLRGEDLIAEPGMKPGPAIGRLLRAVRLAQLAGEAADREGALALARRLAGTQPQ